MKGTEYFASSETSVFLNEDYDSMITVGNGKMSQNSFIYSFSNQSDDRSKASSKTMPPHSAI